MAKRFFLISEPTLNQFRLLYNAENWFFCLEANLFARKHCHIFAHLSPLDTASH